MPGCKLLKSPAPGRRCDCSRCEPPALSDHFHLIVETSEPNLSAGMKWLFRLPEVDPKNFITS